MILVDSSAWIDYDRANESPADLALTKLIGDGELVACTDPVLMEVVAGALNDREERELRRLLTSFGWLAFDQTVDFEGAAEIFRRCRRRGITVRAMVDCLIANVALRNDAEVLAADGDFGRIAAILPLRLHPATPRPDA